MPSRRARPPPPQPLQTRQPALPPRLRQGEARQLARQLQRSSEGRDPRGALRPPPSRQSGRAGAGASAGPPRHASLRHAGVGEKHGGGQIGNVCMFFLLEGGGGGGSTFVRVKTCCRQGQCTAGPKVRWEEGAHEVRRFCRLAGRHVGAGPQAGGRAPRSAGRQSPGKAVGLTTTTEPSNRHPFSSAPKYSAPGLLRHLGKGSPGR